MKIEHQTFGTVDVCKPVGALVDEDSGEFCQHLLSRADRANGRFIVAMQEVPYIDSQALEGLLTAAEALQARSTRLKLVSVTPTCREILDITGLADHFQFFEHTEDAVRSFL